jgi:hypothetical protein
LIQAIENSSAIPTIFQFAVLKEYSFLDFIQTNFDPMESGLQGQGSKNTRNFLFNLLNE